jgi:tetratricopeptide (TPR) repeat protein
LMQARHYSICADTRIGIHGIVRGRRPGPEADGNQLMQTMALVNYYEILEISQEASAECVRLAAKRQRRTWVKRLQAPGADRRREAEDRLALIEAAEGALLDPGGRRAFDARLARYVPPGPRTEQAAQGGDWFGLAAELLEHGDARSAAYAARKATEQRALRHEAWALRGRASFLSGQDQDAIAEFAEALRICPECDEYLFDLGSVYESAGRDKPALDCYEQAAQIAPENPLYQVAISGIYLDNNMPEKALPILEKVYANYPEIDEFTFYFVAALNETALRSWTPVGAARVITRLQQIAPSRCVLERAQRLNPADGNLREIIARNLQIIDSAERRSFRVPAITSARKISAGIAPARSLAGRAGACCALVIFYASMPSLCWAAFGAGQGLGIAVLALEIALLCHLSWRPGWKWNQVDARGITVIRATSAGRRVEDTGR